MPRFFFHIHDGVSLPDREGTVLEDWRAARVEAIRVAGTVLAACTFDLELGEDWCLEVVNKDGLAIFRIDVCLSAGPLLAQAAGSDDRSS